MPKQYDIAFTLTGDVHRNTRGLRHLGALSAAGYSVKLLSLPPTDVISVLPAGVEHQTVRVPSGQGPRHFAKIHTLFSKALTATDARLYHASDLYALPASRKRAKRMRAQLSYDARELYAYVASTVGRPHVSVFWKLVQRWCIRSTNHVWTVSKPIADHISAQDNVPPPTVQFNAPAIGPLAPNSYLREAIGLDDETPIVLHLGQLRPDRGTHLIVDAIGRLTNAHLVFLGYGPELANLRARAKRLGLADRVHFLNPIPPADLPNVVAGADVGVTLLEPTCLNHRYALPNKLFDYLAAGLPIVASDLPAISDVVTGYDCGLLVDPEDGRALSGTLVRATTKNAERERWTRNARAAAETLDWEKASQDFIAEVRALIGPPQTLSG